MKKRSVLVFLTLIIFSLIFVNATNFDTETCSVSITNVMNGTAVVDTNASTACSGAEALLGNGTCATPLFSFSGLTTDDLTEGSSNLYDNQTFNQGLTDGLYIVQANEGNLNVNNSNTTNWWADVSDWVSGWFMKTGNDLDFNETKLNETISALDTNTNCSVIGSCEDVVYNLSLFDTDDLTEGLSNLYDNQSWNQGVVNNLFVPYTGASSNLVLGDNNFSVGTSDFFVNEGTGRVGIGTTSPSERLEVVGSNSELAMFRAPATSHANVYINAITTNYDPSIYLREGGVNKWALRYDSSEDQFEIYNDVANEDAIVVKDNSDVLITSGNVGIGTTSPQNKIDVEGGMVVGSSYAGVNTAPTDGLLVEGKTVINGTSGTQTFDVIGNSNITGTGFFRFLGSIIDRITKIWTTDIDIEGNLNQTLGNATINMVYGEMWFHNDTSFKVLSIPVQNIPVNVSFNSTDSEFGTTLNGFGFTESCNCLITQIAGLYKTTYSISSGNDGNNEEYQFFVSINNMPQNNTDAHRKIGAGGDVGNAGSSGFLSLSVADVINLQTINMDGTSNLEVHSANLNLLRIGD